MSIWGKSSQVPPNPVSQPTKLVLPSRGEHGAGSVQFWNNVQIKTIYLQFFKSKTVTEVAVQFKFSIRYNCFDFGYKTGSHKKELDLKIRRS